MMDASEKANMIHALLSLVDMARASGRGTAEEAAWAGLMKILTTI